MFSVATIAYFGLASAAITSGLTRHGEVGGRDVMEMMKKVEENKKHGITETADLQGRELLFERRKKNENFWFVQDTWLSEANCNGKQTKSDVARISGCTNVNGNSYYTSCSEDSSNLYTVWAAYGQNNCKGPVVGTAKAAQSPVGCQVDPATSFGSRMYCVNADSALDTNKADYGFVEYADDMCSEDPSNVIAAEATYSVGNCMHFNFTTMGYPDYIMSSRLNECGETADFFTDDKCQVWNLTETDTFTYYCHNNNNTDDFYFDDNQVGDDHFENMGSMQHFCKETRDKSKPRPGHRHDENRTDGGRQGFSKPNPSAKGKMKPQEFNLDFDVLMAEYTEQTAATTATYKLALAGGLMCFAGAMVAKFYKSKTGFESVPVESMHSSI